MGLYDHLHSEKSIERLNANITQFNEQKTVPYTISLSIGYDCFLDNSDKSAKEFIEHLDALMYRDKHVNEND